MLTFSCHNITLPEIYQTQYMSAILIYLRIICNVAVLMYLKTKTVIHLTTIGSTQLKPQLSQLATSQWHTTIEFPDKIKWLLTWKNCHICYYDKGAGDYYPPKNNIWGKTIEQSLQKNKQIKYIFLIIADVFGLDVRWRGDSCSV